jgi:hypothetical protein
MTSILMTHWPWNIDTKRLKSWMFGWHVDEEGKLEEVIHPINLWLNHIGSSTITIPSLHFFIFFLNSFWFPMLKKFKNCKGKCQNFESQFLDMWKSHKHKTSLLFITNGYHLWSSWIYAFYRICVSSMVVLHVIINHWTPLMTILMSRMTLIIIV